jgi:cytosine/adenosine deaminase-related metal-dependent hydrolase
MPSIKERLSNATTVAGVVRLKANAMNQRDQIAACQSRKCNWFLRYTIYDQTLPQKMSKSGPSHPNDAQAT